MTRQELNELKDRLYVLAETVKDVEADLTDDESDDERRLLNVLLYADETSDERDVGASAPGARSTRRAAVVGIIGGTRSRSEATAPPYRR